MNNYSCAFFGHREIEITEELKEKLKTYLKDLIENKSVSIFYFGGFGDFDSLCWQIVTELKEKYPFIKRIFCLYDPKHQRAYKRPKWLKEEDYEEFVYLDIEFDYWYSRIYYRNCEIMNRSDYIVFYIASTANSGAYKAMQYAKRKKKNFVNLAEEKLL